MTVSMGPIDIVWTFLLLWFGGVFFVGFMLGRLRRRILGLLIILLSYVVAILFEAAPLFQGNYTSKWLTSVFLPNALWMIVWILIPGLVGYAVGFVLTKKGKLSMV